MRPRITTADVIFVFAKPSRKVGSDPRIDAFVFTKKKIDKIGHKAIIAVHEGFPQF